MNHIYRVVFNRSLGVYQCVSELAKSSGKSSGRAATRNNCAGVVLSALSMAMLGMTAVGAQAVTYSNTQTIVADPYIIDGATDNVTGSSTVVSSTNVIVGDAAIGELIISGAGRLDNADNIIIGNLEYSEGNATITGAGSTLKTNSLDIGFTGKGSVTVAAAGLISAKDTRIGYFAGKPTSSGELIVTGAGSALSTTNLGVGYDGRGSTSVTGGGSISAVDVLIGRSGQSEGNLTVSGNNSTLTTTNITVGNEGTGILNISDNGRVITGSVVRNNFPATSSTINFDNGILALNAVPIAPLFNNFTSADSISLGLGGGTIDTNGNNATVFGNAVIDGAGSFTKTGVGILTMNTNKNKAWGGNTTVNEGTLNLKGDYLIKGDEVLTVNGLGSKLTMPSTSDDLIVRKGTVIIGNEGVIEVAGDVRMGDNNNNNRGVLTVTGTNSELIAKRIVFNKGSHTLDIISGGQVTVNNIRGETNSSSTTNFDNGTLKLKVNQPALFNNFTSANIINLGIGGGTIDTNGNNATVFGNAVINGLGSFTKAGTGTLRMNIDTKDWKGGTKIDQGILELDGDYTMVAGETLTIGLNTIEAGIKSDTNGRLNVDGTLDIGNGILRIDAATAVQSTLTGTWDDIITATTRQGTFKEVTDESPLVNFEALYDNNTVDIRMVKAPVITPPVTPQPPVITPPVTPKPPVVVPPVTPKPPVIDSSFVRSVSLFNLNDLGIANVLDRAIDDRVTNGNNPLADALISSTINFGEPQLAAAANDLQPLLKGATNRIIVDANYMASDAISEHSTTTPNRGLWAKVIGKQGSHDTENGITGYDSDSYGAIAGLDMPITPKLNLGIAVSYIDSDTDSSSRLDHNMTAKSIQALGYGNYTVTDNTQLNFHAGAGRSDVDSERQLSVLSNAIATAEYDVDTLQAGLGVTHRIGTAQRNISPFAQVNYAQAKSDSYRETGAGVYNLDVNENTYESMRWTAGLKMSQAITPRLAVTGQLAAAIENGDRRSNITANFVGNDDSFTTVGQEIGQKIGIAGIGISYMPTLNTTLSAGYQGEWRDNYDDQGASVALQVKF